jgi:type VI secretion system protein ImpH
MTAAVREPDALPLPATHYALFPLLRRLEALHAGSPRLGERGPAHKEAIRLRPNTSLGFPPGEVVHLEHVGKYETRSIVTTNLPGLYGSGSPLPRSYAHQILLEDEEQPQQREFLDLLLHHRIYSLWYRGWKRQRYEQGFDQAGRDPLSRSLLDAIGLRPDTPEEQLGVAPVRLLRYLGLLLNRTRPLAGLQVLLQEELGLPLTIEATPERVRTLPKESWCRLSADPQQGGSLGRDLIVGAKRVDRLGALRLHIGPVPYAQLAALWYGGAQQQRLVALSRFYLRQPLDLIVSIAVPANQIPRQRLGAGGGGLGRPLSLGSPAQDPVLFVLHTSLAIYPQKTERACFSSSIAPSSSV